LDINSGIGFTGGRDKYISALQRFFKNKENNLKKINEFLSGEDYENYMITVHALKSNAKMIGATHLSDGFERLEIASRDGEIEVIKDHNFEVIAEYEELIQKLSPIGEIGEFKAADEISSDVAKQTAAELLDALDDFDDDKSKELALRLSGYPFRITQKEILQKAIEYIEDFFYDEAADEVRKIIPEIE
ncbi:MAG: Hpt domain-containing protein, partial [Eubacterium sp.]|nr:Hpt domain-containing protein [Eubacterium sp.]